MTLTALDNLYAPQAIPHPRRAGKWLPKVSYQEVEIRESGAVDWVYYRFNAPHPGAAGKKLAFVSDIHYSGTDEEKRYLEQVYQYLNKIRPDYLLLGGDLCADAQDLHFLPELLSLLSSAAPVTLAVPGNWECGKSWLSPGYWHELYSRYNIRYLCNQSFRDNDFFIYGCDDMISYPEPPEHWSGSRTNLLLTHRPDTVIALDCADNLKGLTLALCGHTHGGQIRLPIWGPLYASSQYGCRFAYGLFENQTNHTQMLVSAGVGIKSLPWRFHCRREVVEIEFI